jgi:hypothetical protein
MLLYITSLGSYSSVSLSFKYHIDVGEAIKIMYVVCVSGLSQNFTRAVSTVYDKILNFTNITIMGELYVTFGRSRGRGG